MSPHGIITASLAALSRLRAAASVPGQQHPSRKTPATPGKPICTLIRTPVRWSWLLAWRIRPQWRIWYPREHRILRITRILQDLLAGVRSRGRLSNTRRTGLSGDGDG